MATHPLAGQWHWGRGVARHFADKTNVGWQSDNAVDLICDSKERLPVFAVEDGTIGKRIGLSASKKPSLEGNKLTLEAGTNQYYYQHLSSLAPGIKGGYISQGGRPSGMDRRRQRSPSSSLRSAARISVAFLSELKSPAYFGFTDQDIELHPDAHVISVNESGASPPSLDPIKASEAPSEPEVSGVPSEADLGVGENQLRSLWDAGVDQFQPDDAGVPDSAPDLGDDGPAWQPLWHYDGGHLENYWDQGGVPDADPAPDGEGLPDLSLSDGELLASLDLGQVPDDDSLADYCTLAAGDGLADAPWADLAAFAAWRPRRRLDQPRAGRGRHA